MAWRRYEKGSSTSRIEDWLLAGLLLAVSLYLLAVYAEGQWWHTTRFLRQLLG